MSALVFVYIVEVAHSLAQNAPLEWFSSIPGQGVVPRLLSEICWLRIRGASNPSYEGLNWLLGTLAVRERGRCEIRLI